jgi:hypothetical protein
MTDTLSNCLKMASYLWCKYIPGLFRARWASPENVKRAQHRSCSCEHDEQSINLSCSDGRYCRAGCRSGCECDMQANITIGIWSSEGISVGRSGSSLDVSNKNIRSYFRVLEPRCSLGRPTVNGIGRLHVDNAIPLQLCLFHVACQGDRKRPTTIPAPASASLCNRSMFPQ